jgi:cellulose synthase/poly-beta-1,6-N-acetylglucosamine synthase-like glycosyltransferase
MAWIRQQKRRVVEGLSPDLTVLVPVRNEEESLEKCLQGLVKQDYPGKIDIIVLDDFSEDQTIAIARKFDSYGVRIINLSDRLDSQYAEQPNKKRALLMGARESTTDWLLLTDGDTIHAPSWAKKMVASIENQTELVLGPVMINEGKGLFSAFLELDQISLSAISAATLNLGFPSMANGANLLVRKDFLIESGFRDNMDLPTGDDFYLLKSAWDKNPAAVSYANSAESWVSAAAPGSFTEFLNQRRRWLSKSKHFGEARLTLWLVLVYLWVLGIVLSLFINPVFAISMIAFKALVDGFFLWKILASVKRRDLLFLMLPVQVLYLVYVLWAGPAGLWGSYQWKGRKVIAAKVKP